jgi:hypothetical protein
VVVVVVVVVVSAAFALAGWLAPPRWDAALAVRVKKAIVPSSTRVVSR